MYSGLSVTGQAVVTAVTVPGGEAVDAPGTPDVIAPGGVEEISEVIAAGGVERSVACVDPGGSSIGDGGRVGDAVGRRVVGDNVCRNKQHALAQFCAIQSAKLVSSQ